MTAEFALKIVQNTLVLVDLATQSEGWLCGEIWGRKLPGEETGPGSSGDHCGIVSGEAESGEVDLESAPQGLGGEAAAQFAIGSDAPSNQYFCYSEGLGCGEGFAQQIADDGVLEAGDEVERGGVAVREGLVEGRPGWRSRTGKESVAPGFSFGAQVVKLDVAQHRGLDAGKREEEAWVELGDGCRFGSFGSRRISAQVDLVLDLGEGKRNGVGVAVKSELVNPGTAGIAEAEELGDLVVGLAGGIVEGAADELIIPGAGVRRGEVKVGVSAGNDESQGAVAKFGLAGLALMEQNGVDVAFKVVHSDEGEALGEGEGFGVGDSDEESAGEAWAGGDGDGV